jgi:hypothetical protein
VKTFFSILFIVAVILAAYPFLNPSDQKESLTGLPWQIDIMPDGSTQVFGLHIGASRLLDAQRILGDDMEVAIVASTIITSSGSSIKDAGSLEMYYGHYRAGLLSGKLVLHTKASAADIKRWRENAVKSEYMASGQAKKYILDVDDLPQVLNEVIIGLTFAPVVNLDEYVITARFGEASERIEGDGVTHFLYPEKGLDIALYEKAKEVLQYVPPDKFEQLSEPLRKAE